MNRRGLLLLTTVTFPCAEGIVPGLSAMMISTSYLLPEWAALNRAYRNYEQLSQNGAEVRELSIAQSAEVRHRINCFAEGVGVLLGGVIVASSVRCAKGNGVHGLCVLPNKQSN